MLYPPQMIFRGFYYILPADKSAQVIFALHELLRFTFFDELETIENPNKIKKIYKNDKCKDKTDFS